MTAAAPNHDAKRSIIVEAAAEVFYDRGFAAGTTKEIAAKVGLTQPAIYHYVGSKDALLREIVEVIDAHMTEVLLQGLSCGSTPRERMIAILEEFTAAVIRDRKLFAVYYKELHFLPAEVRARSTGHEMQFVQGTARVVRELQDAGQLPAGQPATALAEAILGMASWVYRWYRPDGPLDAPAIARMFAELIGLADTPTPPDPDRELT